MFFKIGTFILLNNLTIFPDDFSNLTYEFNKLNFFENSFSKKYHNIECYFFFVNSNFLIKSTLGYCRYPRLNLG